MYRGGNGDNVPYDSQRGAAPPLEETSNLMNTPPEQAKYAPFAYSILKLA